MNSPMDIQIKFVRKIFGAHLTRKRFSFSMKPKMDIRITFIIKFFVAQFISE